MPPKVIWCADFEFDIRLTFICAEIVPLEPENTQKKMTIFMIYLFNFGPQKRIVRGRKASHSIPKTVRNVLFYIAAPSSSDTNLSANLHFGHFWVIDQR